MAEPVEKESAATKPVKEDKKAASGTDELEEESAANEAEQAAEPTK